MSVAAADYSVHSEATLEGALAALRRILFHREQQHTTWPDEANLALGQFADLIREVKSWREQAIEAVELTPFGESVVSAAGGTGGAGLQPASGDPGDETSEAGLCAAANDLDDLSARFRALQVECDRNERIATRCSLALATISSVCDTLLGAIPALPPPTAHFLSGMRCVCEQTQQYMGEQYTVANPRPE